ncbi:MAG: family 43 glycosylhydrolase [Clostridia bacterium]|nr:family 43 glycosylhydrolase [Clostridia bacterium]
MKEEEEMEYPFDVRDVRISDPFILADPKTRKYYTYASVFNPDRYPGMRFATGFCCICSEDLIHWSDPIRVFDKDEAGFWGDKDYWAPECHIWNGKYYLISSFRKAGSLRRCQCLVSDNPTGPFRPVRPEPVTPEGWQCLDGTLFADLDGRPWMIFCHEWLQVGDGQIAALPLSEDLGSAVGEPEILFRASDAPWAAQFFDSKTGKGGGWVTDGPFLHRLKSGKLIMLWSNFTTAGYATGVARSLSGTLHGPWVQEKNPLYFLDGAHSMLFRSFEGQLMMALHCPNVPGKKRMLLFTMEETENSIAIVNEITGNWYNGASGPAQGYLYEDPYQDKRGL